MTTSACGLLPCRENHLSCGREDRDCGGEFRAVSTKYNSLVTVVVAALSARLGKGQGSGAAGTKHCHLAPCHQLHRPILSVLPTVTASCKSNTSQ